MQIAGQNYFHIILALVFVAVVLLLQGLYLIWKSYKGPEAKKIEQRLLALSASDDGTQQTRLLKQQMLSEVPVLERFLLNVPRVHVVDRFLLQSGLEWTVSHLFLASLATGAFGLLMASSLLMQPLLLGLAAAAMLAAVPVLYVARARYRRLQKMERQLPEALDLMVRALRAGHAFSSALQMAGHEMPEPMAAEFRIVHDEINFGISLQQALGNLCERVPLTDLRYFVVSVMIQRDSGGNLTEVLGNLSRLIRERLKLVAKIRVLSSEGRLSAWVLGVLPFLLGGLMYYVNPEFMAPLWQDPIGVVILKYTLGLMTVGILLLKKLVKLRV
jgi:tight adherence protein B